MSTEVKNSRIFLINEETIDESTGDTTTHPVEEEKLNIKEKEDLEYNEGDAELGNEKPSQTPEQIFHEPFIGSQDQAHHCTHLVSNKHILNGYRINYHTWTVTFKSLFQIHNETCNVWTHFGGFWVCTVIMFILSCSQIGEHIKRGSNNLVDLIHQVQAEGLSVPDLGYVESQKAEFNLLASTLENYFYDESIQSGEYEKRFYHEVGRAEMVTKWPLVAMMLTAMFCLGCSSICHLCYVKDHKWCKLVTHLDYWGICILFLGTTYPFISYKYSCGPYVVWRYIFTSVVSLMTLICMWVTIQDSMVSPKARGILFVIFGLSSAIPTFGLAFWGDPQYTLEPNCARFSLAIIVYAMGLIIYLGRAPERWSKTGRFDIYGQSHTIFHCFVLMGIALTIWDAFETYEARLGFICPDQLDLPAPA